MTKMSMPSYASFEAKFKTSTALWFKVLQFIVNHLYACIFLDEKQGMRNLKMRNSLQGKQTRKTRKCETKNKAFWKLLEEEMIENSK